MRPTLLVAGTILVAGLAAPAFALTPEERIDILWERASLQVDYEKYEDAIGSGQLATRIDPQSPSAWALLAWAQWMSPDGLEPLAYTAAEHALQLDPDSALAHYALGLCLPCVTDPPDFANAIAELEEAVRLDPTLARAWSYLGLTLLDSGDAAGSIEPLRRATEIDPGYYEWHLNLGIGLEAAGRLEDAIPAGRRAAELAFSPFSEQLARNNLAWQICLLVPDDPDLRQEALANARRAVELMPEDAYNLDTLGCAELLFGTAEAAEVALRAAIANGNDSYPALAHALVLQGRDAEAREVLAGASAVLTPAQVELGHAYFAALAWERLGRPEITGRIARHMLATWPDAPWTKQVAECLEQ